MTMNTMKNQKERTSHSSKSRSICLFASLLTTLSIGILVSAHDSFAASPDKKKPVKSASKNTPKKAPVPPAAPKPITTPIPPATSTTPAAAQKKPGEANAMFEMKNSDEPTFIDSDSLTLNSETRIFTYIGNVHVKQGDMTLTSDQLDGKYGEDNKIQQMVAKNNVTITKGAGIKATSNRAVYDASKDMVTLMDNPQLFQDGSILSADIVKVYLQENRSLAEGQVRMKLIKSPEAVAKSASATPAPTTTSAPAP